jgi:hypothetical protein
MPRSSSIEAVVGARRAPLTLSRTQDTRPFIFAAFAIGRKKAFRPFPTLSNFGKRTHSDRSGRSGLQWKGAKTKSDTRQSRKAAQVFDNRYLAARD